MNLTIHVESLREQLHAAAEMGDAETREVIDRLSAGLAAATRLVLLETLSAAADEITGELAPGAVEMRLRGTDPEFVVTLPSEAVREVALGESLAIGGASDEDGVTSRLNLRLPEALKARIEDAARSEGLSLNAWLVRTAAAALDGPPRHTSGGSGVSGQRYTGWVH